MDESATKYMSDKISRRDFLKLAGVGAAATAVLTGCGPASRYVVREPYTAMPEYTYNGQSTYYATTCRECPAGCGIIVRTMQGRAIKIEGNPNHPVNRGKTCARGQTALQGLYNPDRMQGPVRQAARGSRNFEALDWETAIGVIQDALKTNKPDEIAFLLGLTSDHLFDLVTDLVVQLGALPPLRYGVLGMFEGRAALSKASTNLFGAPGLPYFDLGEADVTFSFGANFLETWLSPLAYTRGFAAMRQGHPGRRGYLVQFEPRMSQTAAVADEWIAVKPGAEGLVAHALGKLVAELRGGALPPAYTSVDIAAAVRASGIKEEELHRLAGIFAKAARPLAIPGGAALGQTNGVETAEAVLTLNALIGNLGQPGGVFLTSALPVHAGTRPASTLSDVSALVERMKAGRVKALFVHGVNPLFELPPALGFADALENIPLVLSFASFPDETAMQADYIFPEHTSLESWGYQKIIAGSDTLAISGSQPVVVPYYNTRSTADVLLAAVQAIGGRLAAALPFKDEVEYLQNAILGLIKQNGFYTAPEIKAFWAQWQQYGGWWKPERELDTPPADRALSRPLSVPYAEYAGESDDLHLLPYASPLLGDGNGANRPWLQETPDPMTTVMWGSWVEIHPDTADELGLHDDDVVVIASPVGAMEAVVYRYPAIRPDTIAIPFGQGHTALGRYAAGRGVNPAILLDVKVNAAGDLAFASTRVKITRTGRQNPLARMESRLGVYGEEK